MSETPPEQRAVEHLQQLGLKEYEAKCFVALTGMESGTARAISERIDVPRTRVYEAARVLEERGLIQIQHSSPQRYRAIDFDEVVDVLRERFEERFDDLHETLAAIESDASHEEDPTVQEVWGLTDRSAIRTRTTSLIEDANEEVVLVIGDDRVVSEALLDTLQSVIDREADLVVGAVTERLRERLAESLPEADVFESDLPWLRPKSDRDTVAVGRLLLVDQQALLASTFTEDAGEVEEHAVFGAGFENSLVVIARRVLRTGLGEPARP